MSTEANLDEINIRIYETPSSLKAKKIWNAIGGYFVFIMISGFILNTRTKDVVFDRTYVILYTLSTVFSHLYSYMKFFIKEGEYTVVSLRTQLRYPLIRIFIMYFTFSMVLLPIEGLNGGKIGLNGNTNKIVIIGFSLIKIIFDLVIHLYTHVGNLRKVVTYNKQDAK